MPTRSQAAVISALESGGFAFSKESEGFVNIASPLLRPNSHGRNSSSSSLDQSHSYFSGPLSTADPKAPGTPPPSSARELEERTFKKLREHSVVPCVEAGIKLVQCAGRKDTLRGETGSHSSSITAQQKLQLGLVKCLTTLPRARFISVTLTDTEPASILLEQRLLCNFDSLTHSDADEAVLLGNKEDVLIPIVLDLRDLPMESTGIVCGIAGRLVGSLPVDPPAQAETEANLEASAFSVGGSIEMSYLSTARAGSVMVTEADLEQALRALKGEQDPSKDGLAVRQADEAPRTLVGGDW